MMGAGGGPCAGWRESVTSGRGCGDGEDPGDGGDDVSVGLRRRLRMGGGAASSELDDDEEGGLGEGDHGSRPALTWQK